MRPPHLLLVLFLSHTLSAATVQEEADAALNDGRYAHAIELYRQILSEKPDNYPALFGMARAQAYSGLHQQAIETYNRLDELSADNADVLLGRGLVLMWSGQTERSEADLLRVVELSPEYADVWAALGRLYMQTERFDEAVAAFEKWVALEPSNTEAVKALDRARMALEPGPQETPAEFKALKPDADRWRLRFTASYTDYDESRDDWQEYVTSLTYRHDHGSVAVQALEYYRFKDWDEAVALDVWHSVENVATVHGTVTHAFDPDVIADWETLIEVYRSLGQGWELGGGHRHMDFTADHVDIYHVHAGKYLGKWYARYKASFSPAVDLNVSHFAALRYYFTDRDFAEVYGVYGDEQTLVGLQTVATIRVYNFGARFEKKITDHLWLNAGLSYGVEDPGPAGATFMVGLMLAW